MAGHCKYSCHTATQTLEWIHAVNDFLRPYTFFFNAHVVNFFKDRLWEAVDKEWIDCLRKESIENLLQIPSGVVQDYWPASLKEFLLTLKSLVFPREQAELQMMLSDLPMTSLNNVLTQGMNLKKKHEVEFLAAVVSSIARSVGACTVVDVGAGQGYLAQALSFQYQLSVVAIDACSHHGMVTNARAERIKKHYSAKMHKSQYGKESTEVSNAEALSQSFDGSQLEFMPPSNLMVYTIQSVHLGDYAKSQSGDRNLNVPKTVTCRVLSTDTLKALSDSLLQKDDVEQPKLTGQGVVEPSQERRNVKNVPSSCNANNESSLLLAGLHACGDLSVTMLRTFSECKNVKAVVSIGCCYNLLSEEGFENAGAQCGFPMSKGVKSIGLSLGKSSRDLACQSAERWRGLGKDEGLHNFELHAFRAAFQMVLCRYYPEILITSPTIGRQGKALRRRQHRRILESQLDHEESAHSPPSSQKHCEKKGSCPTMKSAEIGTDDKSGSSLETDALFHGISSKLSARCEGTKSVDKYALFERFSQSGLRRLGLKPLRDIDILGLWKETKPFAEHMGPYWSLRAALGPLVETFLLLDRLLFLQEQGSSLEAVMLPIFDPTISPRNVAIIAKKV